MPRIFGVQLPQTTKYYLKDSIKKIPTGSKFGLYFLYSEFILRANRNPWYKQVLNSGELTAIDGKGLHWAMWKLIKQDSLPRLFQKFVLPTPFVIRVPVFLLLFTLQLVLNILSGLVRILTRYNFAEITQNEVILGRDFVYDLLKIAQDKRWKTMVLGGSSISDTITKDLINRLYPSLELITWNRESTSLLMRDIADPNYQNEILTYENICQVFPDLWDAKQFIKTEKPDLILVCLGGASGKQEFFIENLKQDKGVEFTLATGLGAAVDHLGGGVKQPLPPKWVVSMGMEWLFRFIMIPRRRTRIADSLFTLWWWTTVEQFMRDNKERKTVINIVFRRAIHDMREFLLVKRKEVLPGDVGWTFIQGGIEEKEGIYSAGLRELKEEGGLSYLDCSQVMPPLTGCTEDYTISFLRYVIHKCQYSRAKHFLNIVEYSGKFEGKVNWENEDMEWVAEEEVEKRLSIEKRDDWVIARSAILENEERFRDK